MKVTANKTFKIKNVLIKPGIVFEMNEDKLEYYTNKGIVFEKVGITIKKNTPVEATTNIIEVEKTPNVVINVEKKN